MSESFQTLAVKSVPYRNIPYNKPTCSLKHKWLSGLNKDDLNIIYNTHNGRTSLGSFYILVQF
jgi:hypothetical protein